MIKGIEIQNTPSEAKNTESARNVFVRLGCVDVFIFYVVTYCLTIDSTAILRSVFCFVGDGIFGFHDYQDYFNTGAGSERAM